MNVPIENKIALVTGANRGIGKAIVESFLNHKAKKVYLAVINPESTRELDINVFGLLRVANAFSSILEINKGALVQLNSVASIKNFAHLSTNSASKATAYSLTQGPREKLAEKGVSVVSVHPGPIDTDMPIGAGIDGGESATCVAEDNISALQAGDFHLFPDTMAKQFEAAYQSFSDNIVMADLSQESNPS